MTDLDELRRTRMFPTNLAKAVTGQYGGAYGVVAKRLGLLEAEETTDRMQRGLDWEERIADMVHLATGLYVVGEQHVATSHALPIAAIVDGLLAPTPQATLTDVVAVLETKTRGEGIRPNWDYWNVQVQTQLLVTGYDVAILADTVITNDDRIESFRLHRIESDWLLHEHLADLALELMGHIERGTLPDPDCATALDIVKHVHRHANPDTAPVDLTDIADDVRRLGEVKAAVRAVEAEAKTIEARIRARLGDATRGEADGWKVSLSKPSRVLTPDMERGILDLYPHLGKTVLDRDKAKAEAGDLYDDFKQPIGPRRLTITPPRENR